MTAQPGPNAQRSDKWPLLWLAAAVFILHAAVTAGHFLSTDGELLYRMAESMAFRGNTAVIPIEADARTGLLPQGLPPAATFSTVYVEKTGVFYAQYLPLQPLLSVPLVWLGKLLEPVFAEPFAARLWPTMATISLSPLSEADHARAVFRRAVVVTTFNPIVAALTAVLLARLGRLLTGCRRAGIIAALLWAFGTMAWPHSRTYFTEPLAGLFALVALDQFVRWIVKPLGTGERHAIIMGVALGLANLTRVDSPLLTAGFVLTMAAIGAWKYVEEDSWNRRPRLPYRDVIAAGIIAFAGWMLLQGFNQWRFGSIDYTAGYGDQTEGVKFANPLLIGLHGLLFSAGKGLFWFSPAIVQGLWGWMRAPHHLKRVAFAAFCSYLPFFIVMAKWQNWEGGWCWGPRHIVQVIAPVMLGSAFLFAGRINWKRVAALVVVAPVAVAVQLFGTSQDPLAYYHEYFRTFGDIEYHQVNYNANQLASIERDFALALNSERGHLPVPFARTPAPMIDSLYLPQHTQWMSYPRMWRLGYCDWYFYNAIFGYRGPNRWEE